MVAAATQPTQEPDSPRAGLHVQPEHLSKSVHKDLSCVQCHTKAAGALPHAQEMGPVSCNSACHTNANSEFLQGAHADAMAKGNLQAPTCASCHGGHEILNSKDRQSRTYPLNIVKICGDCHKQHATTDGGAGSVSWECPAATLRAARSGR